jgi:ABC-type branched-subunit amino acid transport system permease subunit
VTASIVISVVLASPGIRVRGDYLMLITFFASLAVKPIVVLTERFSGG